MADDEVGVAENVCLRHPRLDMDVRRHRAELEVAPEREQDADRDLRELVDRGRIEHGRHRERSRDAAEGQVDERAVVAGPPVR